MLGHYPPLHASDERSTSGLDAVLYIHHIANLYAEPWSYNFVFSHTISLHKVSAIDNSGQALVVCGDLQTFSRHDLEVVVNVR